MSEVEEGVGSFVINYTGVFDYYALYQFCLDWYGKMRMQPQFGMYKDKPDGPGIREKEVKLSGQAKVDHYHRWDVDIKINVYNGADVQVDMPDGSKVPMMRGKLKVTISSKIVLDYLGTYNTPVLKKMQSFMNKKLHDWRFKIDQWSALYYCMAEFNQDVKKLLHMDTAIGSFDKGY